METDSACMLKHPGVILHTYRSGRERRRTFHFDVLFDDGYIENIELACHETNWCREHNGCVDFS